VQVSSQKKYFVDQHAKTASPIAKREKMKVNCQEGGIYEGGPPQSDLSDVYLSTLALNVPSTWIKSEKDAGDGIAVSRVASVRRKSNFEIGGKYSSPRAAAVLWQGNSNYYAC
jgi:hypothetical protein